MPLYPGSIPTTERFPLTYQRPLPASPYLPSAGAKFSVRVQVATVEAFYRTAMLRAGWVMNSQGSSGNSITGVDQSMLGFAPRGWQKAAIQESVAVWFFAQPQGSTLVGIFATRVIAPPRPKSSELPGDIQSVTGTMYRYGTKVQAVPIRITNPLAVYRLVRAIKRLRRISAGVVSCPAVRLTAHLSFHPRRGRPVAVGIAAGCSVSVGSVGLWDSPSIGPVLLRAAAHSSA
jgi:hypothetical protein